MKRIYTEEFRKMAVLRLTLSATQLSNHLQSYVKFELIKSLDFKVLQMFTER